jgi:spermidine synthase
MATTRRERATRALLLPLCFASGLAGLTYEVVWHRLLAVVLGNASFATAAVLAAVMGGMGAGALLIGRLADRIDPLRAYALLEILLGATAFAVPGFAQRAEVWSLPILSALGPGWGSFLVRFTIAGTVVLIPALALGATLPVLVRAFEVRIGREEDRVGRAASAIYALNTAGAACGSAVAGYFLLGAWGVRATNQLAAFVDLGVGAAALAISLFDPRVVPAAVGTRGTRTPAETRRTILVLAFATGMVVLGLETVWTRLFLLVFGHDVHAFSAMLSSVLVGLALGAAVHRTLPDRIRRHELALPVLLGALGVVALLSLAAVGLAYLERGLDLFELESALPLTRSHERGIALQGIFAVLTIVPTAAIAGALFPALVARHPAEGSGRSAAEVLAANTAGTLVGPLLTSLSLVPFAGIQYAALLLTLATTAAGVTLSHRRAPRLAAGLLAAFALAWLVLPAELPKRVLSKKIGPAHQTITVYEEGRSATVAVTRNQINGERQIFVNGINEVTTRLVHDQSFMLLGHLGLLLHPEPKDVAVICLGGGLAAGAVATHADVERITIVDLEPAVEHGARAFSDLNGDVLDDPRVSLVIDDGRAHLRTADARYDVIVVDSTHPRAVDSWILYTRELYQTAAARLAEGGVLVQWLPLHGLSVDEFRILVGTFADAFDSATLWNNVGFEPYGQTAYSLLVATTDGGPVDAAAIGRRLSAPPVRSALSPWGLGSVPEVLECLHAGPETLRAWTRGLPRNTDDHPRVQFVTEYTDAAPMTPDRLLEAFAPWEVSFEPAGFAPLRHDLNLRWEAQGLLLTGHLERAAEICDGCDKPPMFLEAMGEGLHYYQALSERYRDSPERLLEVAAGLLLHGAVADAEALLVEAAGREDDPKLWLHAGLVRAAAGDDEGAIEAYRAALRSDPDDAITRINLGRSLIALGRTDRAVIAIDRAIADDPTLADAHVALGLALMTRPREHRSSEHALRHALRLDPRHREAHVLLSRVLLSQRRWDRAAEALREALAYHPYDADLSFNLAVAERERGREEEVRDALLRVLLVDPADPDARAMLSAGEP